MNVFLSITLPQVKGEPFTLTAGPQHLSERLSVYSVDKTQRHLIGGKGLAAKIFTTQWLP